MDILAKIIATKRARLDGSKRSQSGDVLWDEALSVRSAATKNAFLRALSGREQIGIIAEFKRRSPSKGVINADADARTMAQSYEAGGAAGISVLTEEDYFSGSLADLRSVRAAVELPILRKDFIFDEYQIYEAAAAGADAVLLIVAALDDPLLAKLRRITEEQLGLDALVEVHTKEEMRRATSSGAKLIGVNNRDLRTFNLSLETSVALASEAPSGAVLISESGLNTADDLRRLSDLGYKGFLIGESLMRAKRPDIALRTLLLKARRGNRGTGEQGNGGTGERNFRF